MKFIKSAFKWITESTARTLTGLVVLSIIVTTATHFAHAATLTSYDVTNEPQMHLAVNITPTQTSGIILSAPQLNATNHTFATTTGGVLRIRFGAYQEDIRFTGATVNSTTYKVTLVGVTRNLCPQATRTYTSCGDGRSWGIGAIVEENTDARLFNLKMNIDRANICTASGCTQYSGSGSFAFPTFATTALRDQELGAAPPANPIRSACVTGTGLCYIGIGGSWQSIGTAGIGNASQTTAGLTQLATISNLQALTATGSTGAQNVIPVFWVVKNGSGALSAGRIPSLNNVGVLSPTLGGTGTGGSLGVASGSLIMYQGKNTPKPIYPGTNNNILKSNGSQWYSAIPPVQVLRLVTQSNSGSYATNSTSYKNVSGKYFSATGSLTTANTVFEVNFIGQVGATSGDAAGFDVVCNGVSVSGGAGIAVKSSNVPTSEVISFSQLCRPGAGTNVPVYLQWKSAGGGQATIRASSASGTSVHFSVIQLEP